MQNMWGGGARTGIESRWCKSCHAQIKYTGGNTTNLRNHISRFHPVLLTLSVPSIYFCVFFLNASVPKLSFVLCLIHSISVFSFEQVKLKIKFIYLTACIY